MIHKQYEKFVGKVCTILTQPSSFIFKDPKIHSLYFSGIVKEVNTYGILIQLLNSTKMAFYPFPIIGIVEEQSVYKNDPNYEKIKSQLEKKVEKPTPKPASPKIVLSIEEMTEMAKQAKINQTNSRQSSSDS